MKNLSLILNIVLLIAVGVLYYLHFAGPKAGSTTGSTANDAMLSDLKIAYINSDSVLKYYDYLKVNKQQLEAKTQKMGQDYRNRAQGLENEFNAYQRSMNSMTIGQVRATEENLQKKQQNLQLYQQTLQQQLMQEEANLQKQLYDRITTFLKDYSAQKGLQVVFKYDPTSDMLYGGNGLDISQDVITGLNDAYKTEKGGTEAKGDSLAKK
jgi:outer membrane protein